MQDAEPTGISSAFELAVGLACLAAGLAIVRSRGGPGLRILGVAIAVAGAIAIAHVAIAWP